MTTVEKLSVVLPPDLAADVRAAVAGGDYGSVSDVVREALSDWRVRRRIETLETEELRRLVREGIESGPGLYPSRADLASGLRRPFMAAVSCCIANCRRRVLSASNGSCIAHATSRA